jgi:hypothetical protein
MNRKVVKEINDANSYNNANQIYSFPSLFNTKRITSDE